MFRCSCLRNFGRIYVAQKFVVDLAQMYSEIVHAELGSLFDQHDHQETRQFRSNNKSDKLHPRVTRDQINFILMSS